MALLRPEKCLSLHHVTFTPVTLQFTIPRPENAVIISTKHFPVKEVIDEMRVTKKCRNFEVYFNVKYCTVSFGDNNQYTCHAVVTDNVRIADKLFAEGWGSHCYADEAKTMELAVIDMCKKHDLMISRKECSWPFAKATVQENIYKD